MPFPYEDQPDYHKFEAIRKEFDKWIPMRMEESFVLCYGLIIDQYIKEKDLYKGVIQYEDLIDDPKKEMKRILKLFHLKEEHLPLTLEALDFDSQNQTFGHRDDKQMISDQTMKKFNKVFRDMGMAVLNTNMKMETFRHILKQ